MKYINRRIQGHFTNTKSIKFYIKQIFTLISRFTASLGSFEYFLDSINLPSERSGSELKPTIGFSLQNNGHTRLAVSKNVPSPPIGIKMSAH